MVRLLDGIEDMLKQRESLCEILAALSRGTPGKVSSILASCSRRADEAIDLSLRVKLDWIKGAEEAEAKIRAQRRERYEAREIQEEGTNRGDAALPPTGNARFFILINCKACSPVSSISPVTLKSESVDRLCQPSIAVNPKHSGMSTDGHSRVIKVLQAL